MKTLMAMAFVLVIPLAPAIADDSFNFQDPLDIDGNFEEREVSASERLRKLRRQLEKRNEILVRKQIERLRYQQEVEMTKKLERMFDEKLKRLEEL